MAVVKRDGRQIYCAKFTDEFVRWHETEEAADFNLDRSETRRHQSLGDFNILDTKSCNIEKSELGQVRTQLQSALLMLTDKQRITVILHASHGVPFREIGEKFGISKQSAHEIYVAGIKRLKKLLQNTLTNDFSRGY